MSDSLAVIRILSTAEAELGSKSLSPVQALVVSRWEVRAGLFSNGPHLMSDSKFFRESGHGDVALVALFLQRTHRRAWARSPVTAEMTAQA